MIGWLPWLVGSAAFWMVVIAVLRRADEYHGGRRAKRAGEPLNARWSRRKRDGWADQWHEEARREAKARVYRQFGRKDPNQ